MSLKLVISSCVFSVSKIMLSHVVSCSYRIKKTRTVKPFSAIQCGFEIGEPSGIRTPKEWLYTALCWSHCAFSVLSGIK